MTARRALLVAAAVAALATGLWLTPERWAAAMNPGEIERRGEVLAGGALFRFCLLADSMIVALLASRRRRGAVPAPGPVWTAAEAMALAAILVVAAALRVVHLGSDLWLDEIASLLDYVRPPLGVVLTTYHSANQHPLYSLLARASIAVTGESAAAMRLPAALFGVAGVWALAALARPIVGRAGALAGAALLAASYHHVYFSQNARGYTGLLFFTTLGTLLFLRVLRAPRPATFAGYVAAMTLANTLHLTGAVVAVGHGVAWLLALSMERVRRRLRPARPAAPEILDPGSATRPLLLAWAAIAWLTFHFYAPIVPWIPAYVRLAEREQLGWPLGPELLAVILRDAGLPGGLPGAMIVAGGAAFGALGLVALLRRAPVAAAALLLPHAIFLVAVLSSGLGTYPRFYLLALPAGIVVFVAAAGRAPLFPLIIAAAIAANGLLLTRYYRLPKQDFRATLAWLAPLRTAGDAVVTVGLAGTCLSYYDPTIPRLEDAGELEAARLASPRLLVVTTFEQDLRRHQPEIAAALDGGFTVEAVFRGSVGDGDVVVRRARAETAEEKGG